MAYFSKSDYRKSWIKLVSNCRFNGAKHSILCLSTVEIVQPVNHFLTAWSVGAVAADFPVARWQTSPSSWDLAMRRTRGTRTTRSRGSTPSHRTWLWTWTPRKRSSNRHSLPTDFSAKTTEETANYSTMMETPTTPTCVLGPCFSQCSCTPSLAECVLNGRLNRRTV